MSSNGFSPFQMSGRVLSDWRAGRKVGDLRVCSFFLPSPLVREGGSNECSSFETGERFLPQGEGEESYPRLGQAAPAASASQLAISSVPPVGAAIGNRPCPAYCRIVRSPANSEAARTKPKAATIP